MGRRDKRKTTNIKGASQLKTNEKTDKKLSKQFKNRLKEKGEEDIDIILLEYNKKVAKNPILSYSYTIPTSRICASFTSHETKNVIYLFGGEYMDKKQHLYNDFYIYNINNTWIKYDCAPCPPPRSAHQAILIERDGGQLYIFGGEFMSPSQEQFKHYKDLWILNLKILESKNTTEPAWVQISPKNNNESWPPARSGHRMILHKKKILLFGGYMDTLKKLIFYNDLWSFDIDTHTWSEIKISHDTPCPRSGSSFVCDSEAMIAVLYGGIQIIRDKKDNEKSIVLNDCWILDLKTMQWKEKSRVGLPPSLRSGFTFAHCPVKKRMYLFGGVSDLETNLDFVSVFHNDMYWLQLDNLHWFEWQPRVIHERLGKQDDHYRDRMAARTKLLGFAESFEVRKARYLLRKKGAYSRVDPSLLSIAATGTSTNNTIFIEVEEEEALKDEFVDQDSITLATKHMDSVGSNKKDDDEFAAYEKALQDMADKDDETDQVASSSALTSMEVEDSYKNDSKVDPKEEIKVKAEPLKPSPRRNAMSAMLGQTLYVFGGVIENKDKEMTLNDMYLIHVTQSCHWETIIAPSDQQQWFSAFEDENKEDEKSDSEESEEEDESEVEEEDEENDEEDDDEKSSKENDELEPKKNEKLLDFFNRTKEHWQNKAIGEGASADNAKELRKKSFELAQTHFENFK